MPDVAPDAGQPTRRSVALRRTGAAGGLLAIAALAVAAAVFGTGFRDNDVELRASGAWLEHTTTGLAVHVNGATALVDAKVQVGAAEADDPILQVLTGEFRIEQEAELVYLVSEDGCEVLRFDEARLNLAKIPADGAVRRVTPSDDCDRAVVHPGEERSFLVDEATGRIEKVDPRSLDLVADGLVELDAPLATTIAHDARLHAVVEEDGDLVTVDEDGTTRRGLLRRGTGARLVRVGDAIAAVGTEGEDGGDTVVALPDGDGVPNRLVNVAGVRSVEVRPRQLAGALWLSGELDGSSVVVGVDLGDGSLVGPFRSPEDGTGLGAPLAIGDRLVVPAEGNRVFTLDATDGELLDGPWPEGDEAPGRAFDVFVSAGRVWANSPTGDIALRCDELGCTEVEKNDPSVETVQITDPREPDPPKAVSAADREVVTTSTTEAPSPTTVPPVTTAVPSPPTTVEPTDVRIATPPGPVRDLVGRPGDGRASLSWRPPATGTGPFRYRIEVDGGRTQETDGTGHEAVGLTNGRSTTFRVRAVTAAGVSSPMEVTVTPTADVVGNPRLSHVDAAGGKVLADWAWPEGVGSAELACRATDGTVDLGVRTVRREDTPVLIEGVPRDRDVVCDVTTRATVPTNAIRAVAQPRITFHQLVPAGPGQGALSLSVDLGGANTGTATFRASGVAPVAVNLNESGRVFDVPAGGVDYRLDLTIPTDANWSGAVPATGQASIAPRPVTGLVGTPTDTPCCSVDLSWQPPPIAEGSTASYLVTVVAPNPSAHTGCGSGADGPTVPTTSCTLTWSPSEGSDPFDVTVRVEAIVNGLPSEPTSGGPWTLVPPGPPPDDGTGSPDVGPGRSAGASGVPPAGLLLLLVPPALIGAGRPSRRHGADRHDHHEHREAP